MAFTSEDDVKKVLQGGAQSQAPGIDPTGSASGGGAGGAGFIGGGAGGTSPGSALGGSKPFVNIQSYLQGNQPTESEANIIQSDASKIVGQEKDSLGQAVGTAKAQGESESKEKIGVSDATKIVQNAAKGQGDTSAIRQSLDATFDRPEFNYSMGNQFQGAQEAFNTKPQQYANQAYGRAVDGSLSQGQRLLQGQLDAVNPFVQQSLQGVGSQFKDTQDYIGGQTDEIGQYINDLAQTYMGADESLRSGLSAYGGQQQSLAQGERDRLNALNAAEAQKYQQSVDTFTNEIKAYQDAMNRQANQGGGPKVYHAAPSRFGKNLGKQADVNQFLDMVSKTPPEQLMPILQQLEVNPFETADMGSITNTQNPYLNLQKAISAIRGVDFQQGQDYNELGANADATSQFQMIQDLLGGGSGAPQEQTAQGQRARFVKNVPGTFTR
jgi:hypothetical protein